MLDPLSIMVISAAIVIALVVVNLYVAAKLRVFAKLKARKKEAAITLAWSSIVAILVIKSYWLIYVNQPTLMRFKIMYTDVGAWIPHLELWDFLIILVVSSIAGALLLDLEKLLYGLIAAMILSFMLAMIYSILFIWFGLGIGNSLSNLQMADPGGQYILLGLQYVAYAALKNIFRMTFPIVQLMSFLGSFMGAFARGWIKPSAES